jgi:hypothetical protein
MMAAGEKEGSEEDLQEAMVMKMGCCPSGYNALNVDPMALSSDLENESQDAGALFVLESKGVYSSFIHSPLLLFLPPILLFGAFFLWIVSPKWPLYSHWECGNIYIVMVICTSLDLKKSIAVLGLLMHFCALHCLGALCILTGIVAEYVVTGYGSYATET